jgi:uncharacterized protein with HEPN domain
MQRREVLLVGEMIDAAEQAQRLATDHDLDEFRSDRVIRDALLWNSTVLGEAASQLADAFKKSHPGLDWARPTQLRNRIVHGYWSIDLEILHSTALDDLPEFVTHLRSVLDQLEA